MNNLHGLQEMTAHFSNSCNLLKTKLNEENSGMEPKTYNLQKNTEKCNLKLCWMFTKATNKYIAEWLNNFVFLNFDYNLNFTVRILV